MSVRRSLPDHGDLPPFWTYGCGTSRDFGPLVRYRFDDSNYRLHARQCQGFLAKKLATMQFFCFFGGNPLTNFNFRHFLLDIDTPTRYHLSMTWEVRIDEKTVKGIERLPQIVRRSLRALVREIEASGPVRGNWRNYSKLDKKRHHCHIKKGKPTYVAVWEVAGQRVNLVEVIYVGTHEKAPY